MKKLYAVILLILGTTISYSQSDVTQIISEINKSLQLYNANPKLTKVYLNRDEKILDIEGYQIPLVETKVVYEAKSRTYEGVKIIGNVYFKCENSCITNGEENLTGVAFSFKSKDGAYKFIDLIYKLEKILEKD
jgi:hypothetical protein